MSKLSSPVTPAAAAATREQQEACSARRTSSGETCIKPDVGDRSAIKKQDGENAVPSPPPAFPAFVDQRAAIAAPTAAQGFPAAVSAAAVHSIKTKLRKKRSDAPRTASSGAAGVVSHSSSSGGAAPSGNARRKHHNALGTAAQQRQQPQNIFRRLARARWAAGMFLPPLLLLLHRTDRVELETGGIFHTLHLFIFFGVLGTITAVNELLGSRGSHMIAYACVFSFSLLWGGVIVAIRDLTAARFLCMLWFGICCGSLRYHWADHQPSSNAPGGALPAGGVYHGRSNSRVPHGVQPPQPVQQQQQRQDSLSSESTGVPKPTRPQSLAYISQSDKSAMDDTSPQLSSEGQQQHRLRASQQANAEVNGADADNNNNNISEQEEEEEQADYFFLLSQQQRRWNKWGYMWSRTTEYLRFTVWRKTSLCLCASLGEVAACAIFVPNSWSDIIAMSWIGYAAMLILPVVIFKSASWVSHALILVCGSRVNTADASRMLFCYWLTTTVLSLGTLLITMFWIVTSLVPYVWGLQVLMMPYAVACEWIALESREYQATNPYKEIAEVYREHIDTTMQNSKEYFLH
jgi:hypothetical protein